MKTAEQLQNFFEQNQFVVHKINNTLDSVELEKWTNKGVDMIIYLNPFSIAEFVEYVDNFSVYDEIDIHRQDKRYKDEFTISESLKDFTCFQKELKKLKKELTK